MNVAPRRLRQLRLAPGRVDQAIAVALTLLTQASIWFGVDGERHRALAALTAATLTAPVAVRRRWPAPVGTWVPAMSALDHTWFTTTSIGYPLANFLAMYALAVWTRTWQFVVGLGALAAATLLPPAITGKNLTIGWDFLAIVIVVMLFVRRVVGDRDRRAKLAERERDVAAREAVLGERARIARELHDAIAHNVSMMVLQAGAERRVLDDGRGATREVLEAIARTGRSALTEMRRLVGMLRTERADPLAPQPGLGDLPALVTQLREAGLPVDFSVDGEHPALPVGIELSAYRIVQEALTNVLKHAGKARATVRVRYTTDAVELEIADDGQASAATELAAIGGHGLVGMRERVTLYGGRFSAGRRPEGGYAVHVLLPVR
jgi:signal transduction histidine kinase